MRTSLYDYCREHDLNDLLRQWHPSKNEPLTQQTVTYGSKRRIWWRCDHGHEWQAAVYTRTGVGTGCPGENDLASQRPDLAAQWHPAKNRGRTPAEVTPGSHYAAWWVCEHGHECRAAVKTRVSGCPVCAGMDTQKLVVPPSSLARAVL